MSDVRFEQLDRLFKAALETPDAQRAAFLARQCGDDRALRDELQSLLGFHERETTVLADAILEAPMAADALAPEPPEGNLPRAFGRYQLLRVIGQGGMGIVYEAVQDQPRRTVALKVIRPDLAGRGILRRFQLEADVLAQLQHPGIAHIYDAGVADGKQPYFAMEFVRGEPLCDYARTRDLSTRARLELFALICDAVQHAHERGVVHRDLKPGNILVDEGTEARRHEGTKSEASTAGSSLRASVPSSLRASPKILDFGVARVIGPQAQDITLRTDIGQLIGTIPYMSPEQVRGDSGAIDQRSDVYALGVILYELLADRLPLDVRHQSIPEAARIIRDEEPTRLSSLHSQFRGDIDTIVAKALEKDPNRRYVSAGALADDIRRFLRDEPIVARPATTWYQILKFARRHRELVAGLALTFVTLMVGLVVVAGYAMRESRLRVVADENAERSQRNELQARRAAYRANISAAAASIESHEVATARARLDAAPPELRGWEWHYLSGRLDQHRLAIGGVINDVSSLAFSEDASRIDVTLGRFMQSDRPLVGRAWATRDGKPLPPPNEVDTARRYLHPTQQTQTWERTIQRDALDKPPLVTLLGDLRIGDALLPETTSIAGIVATDDLRHIAFWEYSEKSTPRNRLHISRIENGERTHSMHPLRASNSRLLLSRRGTLLWVADESDVAWLRDGRTGTVLYELRHGGGTAIGAAFSNDERRLVTGGTDNTVRLWDVATGKQLAIGSGHTDQVDTIAISDDGATIASGARDGTVRIWDAMTLDCLKVLHGHRSDVRSAAFSRDGQWLATAGRDETLRLWNVHNRAGDADALRGHRRFVYPLAFHPRRAMIASGAWDSTVRFWDLATGAPLRELSEQMRNVQQLAFDATGERMLTWSDEDMLRVWDVEAGSVVAHHSLTKPIWWLPRFAADGRVLIGRSSEGYVTWWNPADNSTREEPLTTIRSLGLPVVEPRGRFAMLPKPEARRSAADRCELVDVQTGESLAALSDQCQRFVMRNVPGAFSPDGRYWISARNDHTMMLLDLNRREFVAELRGHTDEVFAIAFSPDGRRIASAGRDRLIRIWDSETREEVAQLRGHTSYVWMLTWSADGTILASSSGDATVRLWRGHALGSMGLPTQSNEDRDVGDDVDHPRPK